MLLAPAAIGGAVIVSIVTSTYVPPASAMTAEREHMR
jgi:hypothetical protein